MTFVVPAESQTPEAEDFVSDFTKRCVDDILMSENTMPKDEAEVACECVAHLINHNMPDPVLESYMEDDGFRTQKMRDLFGMTKQHTMPVCVPLLNEYRSNKPKTYETRKL